MSVIYSARNLLHHVETFVTGDSMDSHEHHRLLPRLLVTLQNLMISPTAEDKLSYVIEHGEIELVPS